MIYFTSDTHFGHTNIIEYCERPFRDTFHMDNELIDRWNARVKCEDTVYHLGDFAFGTRDKLAVYRARLNGEIVLVRGNHDRSPGTMRAAGLLVADITGRMVTIEGVHSLRLSHKPLKEDEMGTAQFNLHGHVHRGWVRKGKQINVGVDVRDFEPKTLEELLG